MQFRSAPVPGAAISATLSALDYSRLEIGAERRHYNTSSERHQKGLTGCGVGTLCPRSQAGGKGKSFGLCLFPAKDIKRQSEFVRVILLALHNGREGQKEHDTREREHEVGPVSY